MGKVGMVKGRSLRSAGEKTHKRCVVREAQKSVRPGGLASAEPRVAGLRA
jgi:hypothetical protein